jgi:hypothetical protein
VERATPERRRRGTIAAAALAALLATAVAVAGVVHDREMAASPPAPAAAPGDGGETVPVAPAARHAPPTSGEAPAAAVEPLAPATPTSISIAGIGVDAPVMELGLHDDGSVEVPPHAPRAESKAGWYRHSPTPGEVGPSVVVGHVDSARHGPSVFFELGSLAAGDLVEVRRDDGLTAVFAVERTVQYAKDRFPLDEVYGNLDHPGLRLITCGGAFDTDRLEYEDNIVVYATLVSSHASP